MQFKPQTFTVSDLYEWYRDDELILQPRFQRRLTWSNAAKSYLLDTVGRGLPIPKIFLRMDIDPVKVKAIREVVDGQQRLDALFKYIRGEFRVYHSHNEQIGGKFFQDLPPELQTAILSYEVSADLLLNADDATVYDIFARINSYGLPLNEQEKRNAKFFGIFKQEAYSLGTKYLKFWKSHSILTDGTIARMAEAELASELMIGLLSGLQDKKGSINTFYTRYEDDFPQRKVIRTKFDSVIAFIDKTVGDNLQLNAFKRRPLFYTLFLAVADGLYGIPNEAGPIEQLQAGRPDDTFSRTFVRGLETLSEAISMQQPPEALTRFVVASLRQTDNIAPRRLRHQYLYSALSESATAQAGRATASVS